MAVTWCEACVEKKRAPLCRYDAVMMLVFGEGKHDQVEGTKQLPKTSQPRRHGQGTFTAEQENPKYSNLRNLIFWQRDMHVFGMRNLLSR
jgi:hypothetical protein